jgi:hypothetical protein
MNFNIIDGNDDYLDHTQEFIELYNNPEITVPKIREKLDITLSTYRKLRKHCIENKLVSKRKSHRPRKRTYKTNPKYYCHTVQRGIEYYHVQRRVNGEMVHFANFKKAKHAERMVELLIECDWDKSKVPELKELVLNE